ncbi:hypothetical protein CHU98_g2627 [Xylaria longipes]|nr:hypothetical protein CHU98_g2627 [Xylaria longipes]
MLRGQKSWYATHPPTGNPLLSSSGTNAASHPTSTAPTTPELDATAESSTTRLENEDEHLIIIDSFAFVFDIDGILSVVLALPPTPLRL